MDCNEPKCCDLNKQAQEQIAEFCKSRVYPQECECIAYIVDSSSRLYTVDLQTGANTLIGAVGFSGVTDIAWDGTNLWGITSSQFIQINIGTGAGTAVGATGASLNALEADGTGTIYAMGGGNFYTINSGTGAATLVGPLGSGLSSSGDLALDANGNMFGSFTNNTLGRIDVNTGAASVIGPFGFSLVWGLDFCGPDLFGITSSGVLLSIDPNTGAATSVANTGVTSVFGMSIRERCTPVSVPCKSADLPNLEPIFTVRWGDEIGDEINSTDVECLCVTACNPYDNVSFKDVMVYLTQIYDSNGNPVDPKNVLLKPGSLICFGDLAPCEYQGCDCSCGGGSCASREFVLLTNDAKPGEYTFIFEYCYKVEYCQVNSYRFQLEVKD